MNSAEQLYRCETRPPLTAARDRYPFSIPAALWYFGAYAITVTLAVPTYTHRGLAWALGLHLLAGCGITLGAHRYFSHATFKAPKFVEWSLGLLYLLSFDRAGQGLISWVVAHREHHKHADEPDDPHSPQHGFWWAFAGHHLWRNPEHYDPQRYYAIAPTRLTREPFVRFIDRQSTMWGFQVLLIIGLALWGDFRGGTKMALSFVVWGVFVRFAITQTLHSLLDTLNHGCPWPFSLLPDRYRTNCLAKNQYVLWPFQLGNETHHNFHHAFPRAANNGGSLWRLWHWDMDSLLMKLGESLGIISGCHWITTKDLRAREAREAGKHSKMP